MNTAPIVRIVLGGILLLLTAYLYTSNRSKLDEGHGFQILGYVTSLSASQAVWIYIATALVGVAFIAVGIMAILRSRY